jgi:hypothetical protein
MIQPTNNQAINLIKMNNLVLQWQKNKLYRFLLYRNLQKWGTNL